MAQGTRRRGSKLHSIVSVSGRDLDKCFGVIGAGHTAFCIRKDGPYTHQEGPAIRTAIVTKERCKPAGRELVSVCVQAGAKSVVPA